VGGRSLGFYTYEDVMLLVPGIAQVVEHLPGICKALDSILNTAKKKKRRCHVAIYL
jgi:hypothetical protein